MAHPDMIWGTGLLGLQLTEPEKLDEILQALQHNGFKHIETAARYPPPSPGVAENMLGDASVTDKGFTIDTKVAIDLRAINGHMKPAAIEKSIEDSCQRLHVQGINVYYCQGYDPETPVAETIGTLDKLYKQGKFQQWGVCNFPPEQLEEYLSVCEEHGYVKPTVYQGEYNVVTRGAEKRILPILRAHHMHYYPHRPFATGFLSGKFTSGNFEGTRFAEDFALGHVFRGLYGQQELHDAMSNLLSALKRHNIGGSEAALRWIMFHSALQPDDKVIFSSYKVQQIEENAQSIKKGPLPDDVVRVMDDMWPKYAAEIRGQIL